MAFFGAAVQSKCEKTRDDWEGYDGIAWGSAPSSNPPLSNSEGLPVSLCYQTDTMPLTEDEAHKVATIKFKHQLSKPEGGM